MATEPPLPADPNQTGPVAAPGRDLFGPGGPVRRVLRRWGFPAFVVIMIYFGRRVLLPFVFAALVAYILAPVVRWMAERKDGTRRMPRGLAIIICYIVFISAVVGFFVVFVPRLSKDAARIGKEAPALYDKANTQWIPELARTLEKRFPSLKVKPPAPVTEQVAGDVPLPPGSVLTLVPLPDGTFAAQLPPTGILIKSEPGGGYRVLPAEQPPEPMSLEEKLRGYLQKGVSGLQSQMDDLMRFGQAVVGGLIKGVFTFFLVLMIGAFILIDMEKVHAFLRSLFPPNVRDDYDVIIAGIDRGLSGVIRGQLLICLINGILTYIGLLIFDVKYSLILAFVAAAMSLIPIFGSILSTIPIVLAALVSGDSGLDVARGIAMVAWIVGIHFIEANFLNPKIIGTAAKIHPVLVIFSLILGEKSYGLIGALFAVPVLSMISVVFLFFYKKAWKDRPATGAIPTLPKA
ncbi:MAG: AI-2E family transporter [Kofleriaceae bacterium]|jgi:predicted PurR-regulated permease PerM|nr:AI-2E family transporter [Kofleriaceae bacterium]MBP9172513.1 AI-2E family transporter [Kofleriaceae bacterium]MBP9861772.1 AI-2E family transporter [Kofleriaceae bacterium]